ncbi:MAG: hypothetical protein ABIG67_06785 [Pseudomonadota bacterium]
MGLRIKILSGFLILTIMLFVAGIWSIYELRTLGTSVQMLLDDNYKSINAAKMMIVALEREDSGILLLLSGNWEEGRSIMEPADTLFGRWFEIAKNNVTVPGEQAYIDKIEAKYRSYKDLWVKPIVGTGHERDLNWYFQGVHKAFLEVKDAVEGLMSLNDQTMYKTASDLKGRAQRAVMPGFVAILSSLIFALIFNYFINYYVVSPIIKVTEAIGRFLKTREPFQVQIETQDELLRLVNSIRELLGRVKIDEGLI